VHVDLGHKFDDRGLHGHTVSAIDEEKQQSLNDRYMKQSSFQDSVHSLYASSPAGDICLLVTKLMGNSFSDLYGVPDPMSGYPLCELLN